uniref:Uncharacterized protein n=1 Tax=Nelumbo nucifera TaxID=4432 RepID=A0A822XZX6_NELNU|nr:TPA_asm: hypothetical protein HUJ06_025809 [Nelumbo nucifera]
MFSVYIKTIEPVAKLVIIYKLRMCFQSTYTNQILEQLNLLLN